MTILYPQRKQIQPISAAGIGQYLLEWTIHGAVYRGMLLFPLVSLVGDMSTKPQRCQTSLAPEVGNASLRLGTIEEYGETLIRWSLEFVCV